MLRFRCGFKIKHVGSIRPFDPDKIDCYAATPESKEAHDDNNQPQEAAPAEESCASVTDGTLPPADQVDSKTQDNSNQPSQPPIRWTARNQTEYVRHMMEQGGARMISPHHNVKDHKEGWDIDHDVIHIAPTCQNCVWHHMDSCTDNGDTDSNLGDEQRCVCNIEAATESAQSDIRAEHTSSKTNNTTTDAENDVEDETDATSATTSGDIVGSDGGGGAGLGADTGGATTTDS